MKTSQFGFGIVGTGMIAGVIAEAISKAENATLTAVSSRRIGNARAFVAERPGASAVEGVEALLAREDVEAVYIATPTVAKEAIALAAIAAGKHILIEKPFIDLASVRRMTEAAAAKGVVLMDATHFVHHPRTASIQGEGTGKIGSAKSLHTTFYFPFSDRENIRFDATQEPMTALGDLGWYSMRAVVEFLRPQGKITKTVAVPERDPQTGAIVRTSGLIAFDSGEVSTFDIGYTAGTILMDLQLPGTAGVITMDDFVLDWSNSWSFKNPEIKAGWFYRTGMGTRSDVAFIATPSVTPQDVLMVENFVTLARTGTAAQRAEFTGATLKTQEYLDAIWTAAAEV